MDITMKIKAACGAYRIPEAEVARRIGSTPSAFNQRMKTGKFSSAELDKIAEALGAEFVCYFKFPDGTEI